MQDLPFFKATCNSSCEMYFTIGKLQNIQSSSINLPQQKEHRIKKLNKPQEIKIINSSDRLILPQIPTIYTDNR